MPRLLVKPLGWVGSLFVRLGRLAGCSGTRSSQLPVNTLNEAPSRTRAAVPNPSEPAVLLVEAVDGESCTEGDALPEVHQQPSCDMAWPGEGNFGHDVAWQSVLLRIKQQSTMMGEPVPVKPSVSRLVRTSCYWCRRRMSSFVMLFFSCSMMLLCYQYYVTFTTTPGFSARAAVSLAFGGLDPYQERLDILRAATEQLLSQPNSFDDTMDPLQGDPELKRGLVHLLSDLPKFKVNKDTPVPSSLSPEGMVYFILPEGPDIRDIEVDADLKDVFPRQNTQVVVKMQREDAPELARLWSVRMDATHDGPLCQWYNKQHLRDKVVVPNVWHHVNAYNTDDVTLVTQLDGGRMRFLQKILTNWEGALSVAVHLDEKTARNFSAIIEEAAPLLLQRRNVDVHLVLKTSVLYPVNYLRALALNNSYTDYVFLSDGDLVPSVYSHDQIKAWTQAGLLQDKKVFVVAAFEALEEIPYPRTKKNLTEVWDSGQVIPFFSKTFAEGHAATNYRRWRNFVQPYKIDYNGRYEPYIVMKRAEAPSYNEQFVGYFKNKIIYLTEVHLRGFEYWVLPDVFTIHYPHAKDVDISFKWATRSCVWNLADKWLEELKVRLSTESDVISTR